MNQLIDINTLAEKLSVKPMTIYGWIHEGVIPHFKLGRLVRFDEEVIEEWLKVRKVNGRSQRALDINLQNTATRQYKRREKNEDIPKRGNMVY